MDPSGKHRWQLTPRLWMGWCAVAICAVLVRFGSESHLSAAEPFDPFAPRNVRGAGPAWPASSRQIGRAMLAAPAPATTLPEPDQIFEPEPMLRRRPNPFELPGLIVPAASQNHWDDPGAVFTDAESEPFRPLDESLPPECLSLDPSVPPGTDLTQVSVCDPESGVVCGLDYPWSRFDEGRSPLNFFAHDLYVGGRVFLDDTKGLFRARNIAFLGLGLGGALAARNNADANVRAWSAKHPHRWGEATRILDWVGRPEVDVPVVMSLYGWSIYAEDEDLLRFSRLMIRSYSLTAASTVLVKVIADTHRPSQKWLNGRYGFPSAHASTTFALAATVEEYYGLEYGIPAYLLAGAVSFSRIDDRDHDLSDVIFGAVLGFAIGKSVAGRELRGDSRIRFLPWNNAPNRATGMAVEFKY